MVSAFFRSMQSLFLEESYSRASCFQFPDCCLARNLNNARGLRIDETSSSNAPCESTTLRHFAVNSEHRISCVPNVADIWSGSRIVEGPTSSASHVEYFSRRIGWH